MLKHPGNALARMAALALVVSASIAAATAAVLPSRLADREFWTLVSDLSEPGGSFRSENLLSNELRLQYVIPELTRATRSGGAYVGVGPEQNFTYIATVHPSIAFIVDIRRGNQRLQLMYKALFEISNSRVDFVSRLFSRTLPDGLGRDATVAQIFDAAGASPKSEPLYRSTLEAMVARLQQSHGFPLTDEDKEGIAHVFHAFYTFGPAINYASSEADGGAAGASNARPTYADLMTATDSEGRAHGFLATEDAFASVKALEANNLVVPIVGDFAGPRALRALGAYLKSKSAVVSAFYVSNVEQYLRVERVWGAFCGNAARLPIDDKSVFIRAGHGGRYGRGGTALTLELTSMSVDLEGCDRRP